MLPFCQLRIILFSFFVKLILWIFIVFFPLKIWNNFYVTIILLSLNVTKWSCCFVDFIKKYCEEIICFLCNGNTNRNKLKEWVKQYQFIWWYQFYWYWVNTRHIVSTKNIGHVQFLTFYFQLVLKSQARYSVVHSVILSLEYFIYSSSNNRILYWVWIYIVTSDWCKPGFMFPCFVKGVMLHGHYCKAVDH